MTKEKSKLDKFRDLYLPTVREYEKKLADTLSYYAGPELTKIGQGIKALLPFQNIPDLTPVVKDPSLKNIGKLASDVGITAAELFPPTLIASKIGTAPGKVSQKVLKDIDTKPTQANQYSTGTKREKVEAVLNSVENPKQYSLDELMNLPQVKKVLEENNISKNLFKKYKSKAGLKQTSLNVFERSDVNTNDVINFLEENPFTTTKEIKVKFPKLKDVKIDVIDKWRQKNNLTKPKVETPGKKILEVNNPKLQEQLDFIPEGSTIPIKHKNAFSEIITINKKTGSFDTVRTKIVQAHGIGEGGILNASDQIIKSKVAMIPDKFLKNEKLPKFFLTKTGNDLHRKIEDNLVLALVNKYDKLGYNFVNGAWKQTKKINPKSVSKELKDLETEIVGYQDQLKKLDAYTLFYNPVKDKMVTHGKPLSEIPGLGNLLNQVKKGTKKLKDGGIVGIDYLTRPLGNF